MHNSFSVSKPIQEKKHDSGETTSAKELTVIIGDYVLVLQGSHGLYFSFQSLSELSRRDVRLVDYFKSDLK